MKICVFGADGRTGKEVVREAVARGHEVKRFMFKAPHETADHNYIGDVTNYDQVLDALQGCEAVISVVGHIKGSNNDMQTRGIENIVSAMEQLSIDRLISLTGTGARVQGDTPSLIDRLSVFALKFYDRARVGDGLGHIKVLEASSVSWTVLRVLKLSKSIKMNKFKLTPHGPGRFPVSRKTVAKIMVDLVETEDFINEYPVVSR